MAKRKSKRKRKNPTRQTPVLPRHETSLSRWVEDVTAGLRRYERGQRTYPVVRLTKHGSDHSRSPGPGDEIGYGMDPFATDNCLAAAIATVTQIPIAQVPELKVDKRLAQGEDPEDVSRTSWERIATWASKRGLRPLFHEQVPVPLRRWIGVVVVQDDCDPYGDHCLVMCHDRIIFEPSCTVRPGPGFEVKRFRPDDITYGLSFQKEK